MANTIEAAELIEAEIEKLQDILKTQELLKKQTGNDIFNSLIQDTKDIIEQNKTTVKYIKDSIK